MIPALVSTTRDAAEEELRRMDVRSAPTDYRVPMSAPDIAAEDVALVTQALHSKILSLGPFLDELEKSFAAYIGTRHAVAATNGTAGLQLCVRAAGIADGDEVITTPFSFVASTNCLLYERTVPVFVDIDEMSFNLDPALVAGAVSARTRAVLPVHVFGQPCEMDALQAACSDHGLLLIEDACEAVGADASMEGAISRRIPQFG